MSPIWPSDPKPILFIMAGSIQEYDYFRNKMFNHYAGRDRCPYEARYLHDESKLRGHRDQNFICYGNWHRKPDRDLAIIRELLRHGNHKELGHSDIFGVEDESVRGTVDYKDLNRVPTGFEFFDEEEFNI